MARSLPKPGYYKSGDRTVIVIGPDKLSDQGEILTKDGDAANWRPAVAFRLMAPGSPLYVLSADTFDGRFKPISKEEAFGEVQAAEAEESKRLAAEAAEKEGAQ